MMWFLIVVFIILFGVLVFLSGYFSNKKKTKEESLKEIIRVFGGTREPIPNLENSYRIRLKFENQDFIFEDLEERGFREIVNKVFLKIKTNTSLNLTFTELEKATTMRSPIVLASQIKEEDIVVTGMKIYLPKPLKDLKVNTNDAVLVNKLFEDDKIADIFIGFKNTDTRGYPSVSLKIVEGILTLEFGSRPTFRPSLLALRSHVSSLEDYLETLLIIVKKINNLSHQHPQ